MKDRVNQAISKAENDFNNLTQQIEFLQRNIVEGNKLIKQGVELKDAAIDEIKKLDEKRQQITGVINFLKEWEG